MLEHSPLNRLYQIRDGLLKKGEKITDLVSGNVSTQGIEFPQTLLRKALSSALPKSKFYKPDPLGQKTARQAISRYYAGEGVKIDPEQILLTPGTSISYWYAFKALMSEGDEVLAPVPSYPLFDSIAHLSGVKLVPYPLRERDRWEIDFDQMEAAITPRTKAIILISPHNPTGAVATDEEVQRLSLMAADRGLAIISDEVFSPFLFGPKKLSRPAGTKAPLVLTLNGFSKMLALPGVKIGWMVVSGESGRVETTLRALDMISDTFLPVNELAQLAVPPLLNESRAFQSSYRSEMGKRMAFALELLQGCKGIRAIQPEGGFFLSLQLVGNALEEEGVACRLLEKNRILVHPGYFYDMEGSHLVLSFASRPQVLRRSLGDLIQALQ